MIKKSIGIAIASLVLLGIIGIGIKIVKASVPACNLTSHRVQVVTATNLRGLNVMSKVNLLTHDLRTLSVTKVLPTLDQKLALLDTVGQLANCGVLNVALGNALTLVDEA